jgi:Ca2+-binding RTX toxin-like protein
MANTNVSTSSALRTTIQTAGTIDSITLEGITPTSEPSGYSVLTLAKRSSFAAKKATPSGGYTIQGTSSNLANSALLINTRIYQQNVDGVYAPGSVKNLTLSYVLGGQADNGALLSVTSAASRSITLENILITGGHKGWNGNGNLYMSLRSFNAAAPLNTSLALTSVIVNLTGQNNSFNGTTGGSAFFHSWNNSGAVRITGSNFDEAGFASSFNLLTFGATAAGSYTLTNNTFRRTSNQTVRPEGNRLGSVVASLSSNTFQDGSYLDLYGTLSSTTLTSNTFSTIANGYGIRVTANGVSGTPTLAGTTVFTGPGLPLKYLSSTANTSYSLTGTTTVNGASIAKLTAGGQGIDTLTGAIGNDWINGDDGDDSVSGDNGNDLLLGGSGADVLDGGNGNDTLTGGTGADKFTNATGVTTDIIIDFSIAEGDQIRSLGAPIASTTSGNTFNAAAFVSSTSLSVTDAKVTQMTVGETISNVAAFTTSAAANGYLLFFDGSNGWLYYDNNWNTTSNRAAMSFSNITTQAGVNAFTNSQFFRG